MELMEKYESFFQVCEIGERGFLVGAWKIQWLCKFCLLTLYTFQDV